MDDKTYVLLWSQSQNCFHIERAIDMLAADADAFKENRRMDYVPLVIGKENECDAMANKLRPILRKREAAHVAGREFV
jgi:hypothetical protein